MSVTVTVGTRVFLKWPMLGNPAGAMGYVVETYPDFDKLGTGAVIIFSNGNYDGFSVKEQTMFLAIREVDERYADYEFDNVIKLGIDYKAKYWDFTNYAKDDSETA